MVWYPPTSMTTIKEAPDDDLYEASEKARLHTNLIQPDHHPHTIQLSGETIFEHFEEAFDEIDALIRVYLSRGLPMPRIVINASRLWSMNPPRFDTVPDECIHSFCSGIPSNKIVMDFSDVFSINFNM